MFSRCVPPADKASGPATVPAAQGEGLDILVVDDQADVRETISLTLEDDGHRVEVADSGATALERMARRSYRLGVIDFAMPGMNGAELIAAARKLYPEMRFLIVTAISPARVENAARHRNPAKPFEPEQCAERSESRCYLRGAAGEAAAQIRLPRANGPPRFGESGDGEGEAVRAFSGSTARLARTAGRAAQREFRGRRPRPRCRRPGRPWTR